MQCLGRKVAGSGMFHAVRVGCGDGVWDNDARHTALMAAGMRQPSSIGARPRKHETRTNGFLSVESERSAIIKGRDDCCSSRLHVSEQTIKGRRAKRTSLICMPGHET